MAKNYICSTTAGIVVQELNYTPWGALRDPATRQPYLPDSQPDLLLDRDFTGHEHLTTFGLINMNARLYDPAAGRFLNPDPIIQAPDNTQNLNRYTYCLNNPLRYTDENGEFILGFIFGFFKGLFTGKNVFKTAWKTAVNETKILVGLFIPDTKRGFWHALGELVSRFTWQLPQTLLGYGWTQTRNYLGGATFATHENSSKERGITIGNYVNIDNPKSVEGKFANYVASNPLYMHEYGHYLDSQRWGPIYLFAIGAPSLINQIKHPDSHIRGVKRNGFNDGATSRA